MKHQDQFIVVGGEVEAVDATCHRFRDVSKLHFVGGFETHQKAKEMWKGYAQMTVDNAHMRYFIVPVDLFFPIAESK